jgi:hypothetical protein
MRKNVAHMMHIHVPGLFKDAPSNNLGSNESFDSLHSIKYCTNIRLLNCKWFPIVLFYFTRTFILQVFTGTVKLSSVSLDISHAPQAMNCCFDHYCMSITSSSYFTLEEFKYSAACFIPLISIF